jgi:putative PIN family toxin of toxin-antitoxin system
MSKAYIFDTNVMISAILSSNSVPRQAFNFAFNNGIILLSDSVKNELIEVLSRAKFAKYITTEKRNLFLFQLFRKAKFVNIIEEIKECRDEKDNKFLELAVNGKADFIVTGDQDLLVLNPFRDISIISPKLLLQTIKSQENQ